MMKRVTGFFIFFTILNSISVGAGNKDNLQEIHNLNREIVLLNLINGLHLSREQTEILIDYNSRANEARDTLNNNLVKYRDEMSGVLNSVREILLDGGVISDDLKKKVHRMKQIRYDLDDQWGEVLTGLESAIREMLTPNQLLVIENYKPCTIPPEEGKIGQSTETAAKNIVRVLTHIREMPPDRYDGVKEIFADRYIERVERYQEKMDENVKAVCRQKILTAFEESRCIDDREFLIRKADLAGSLMPEETKKHVRRKNDLGKVGHFLLDPVLPELLAVKQTSKTD